MLTPFKLLMEECAIDQNAGAELFKVSVKTIQAWMQGARNAPPEALLKLQQIARAQDETARIMAASDSMPNGKERGLLRKYFVHVNPDNLIKGA